VVWPTCGRPAGRPQKKVDLPQVDFSGGESGEKGTICGKIDQNSRKSTCGCRMPEKRKTDRALEEKIGGKV